MSPFFAEEVTKARASLKSYIALSSAEVLCAQKIFMRCSCKDSLPIEIFLKASKGSQYLFCLNPAPGGHAKWYRVLGFKVSGQGLGSRVAGFRVLGF